jgi:hypothetical protein
MFAFDILKTKFAKVILKWCLVFHVTLLVIQIIYFHLCVLGVEEFIKFSPAFFGMFYVNF